jgi:hypothetical protein
MLFPNPFEVIFVLVASGAAAYLLSRCLRWGGDRSVRLLAWLVLWEALQILPVHVLAALQLSGVIARVDITKLAMFEGAVLLVAAILARGRSAQSTAARGEREGGSLPMFIKVCIAVMAISYFVFAANILTGFPLGSDALIYHLPLATRWLQNGSLALPASGAWQFSMPGNAEIGMMVLLGSGTQGAVAIANWVPAAILALSTYLLCMRMSGSRTAAIAASLIVFSIPMVEAQAFSAYVDLLGTAGILASVTFALSVKGGAASPATLLFLSGLACGISIGTKPVYYLYAVFCSALIGRALWEASRAQKPKLWKWGSLVIVGLLLPSAFWFGRALQQTGNPVYPIQLRVGNRVVLRGYAPSQITEPEFELNFVHHPRQWVAYPWTEWKSLTGYLRVPYGEGDGLGGAFAAFVPLGILFFVVKCFRGAVPRERLALLFGFLLLVGAWWLAMERVLRFGQVIWIFGCILAVPLIVLLEREYRRAFGTLLVVTIAATALISASVPLHLVAGRVRKHLWSRSDVYNYPKFLDQLPPGSTVVNATGGKDKNFALAGRQLNNRVIASFEAPPTAESLHGPEYVVETVPGVYPETSLVRPGAVLVDDEWVSTGEEKVRWRVWKVN